MATKIYLGYPPENIKKWIKAEAERKDQERLKTLLHFTANEDNSSVSLICCVDNYDSIDCIDSFIKLDYSIDGKVWSTYIDPDSEDETLHRGKVIYLNKGETVYFKATLGDNEGNPNLNGFTQYDEDTYAIKWHYFVMEGSIKADGNIQFLLENTGTKMDVPESCYISMFEGCTSLTQAPMLPATTLAYYCYESMFSGCSSLTKAPELPAKTLVDGCYLAMFEGCTSLTQTPELPATTLARNCYYGMFSGCSSLTKAPELPAKTLVDGCYLAMFEGCTSLTQAPKLPATTLVGGCYQFMFQACTSLTQAPELPAITLAEHCYYGMFEGCTKLNNINVNFLAWNPIYATVNWVSNVSSSGTFTCLEALPEEFGNNRIPTGWTIVRK